MVEYLIITFSKWSKCHASKTINYLKVYGRISNEKYVLTYLLNIQGVSFEILLFQMAVAQKRCIFDPMLAKPKWV